jgi:putative ABC transport system substrate-binding protein
MRAHPTAMTLSWLLLVAPTAATQAPAVHRLGVFFWHDSPNDVATFAGIQHGLRTAGAAVEFVQHHADSDPARATAAFTALRAARCDVVFALGTQATLLAKAALPDVPIVFAAVSDAVASGVVADWGGSGRRLCGASNWIAPGAVLDVFRLAVPGMRRLGMVRSTATGIVSAAELATMRAHLAATPDLGITVCESVATGPADLERAATDLVARGVDAIWIPIDLMVYGNIAAVRRGVQGRPLPLLTTAASGVADGADVGAAVDYELHGRRAAALALRVLAGADPGQLPIDRMCSTLVKVNLGTARAHGIELPLSLLAVADELVDVEMTHGDRR